MRFPVDADVPVDATCRVRRRFHAGPDAFPPDGAIPTDVPILFTVAVDAPDLTLFSVLRIQLGDALPTDLIVIGCSPTDTDILFCLDPGNAAIMMLDLDTGHPAYEPINTTFAAFVEFLYRLDELISDDPGGTQRADQAEEIRHELTLCDFSPRRQGLILTRTSVAFSSRVSTTSAFP